MTTTKKTIAIFGATGQQGGSLLHHILTSPHLSSQFNIRALTRDPSSPASQRLLSSYPSSSSSSSLTLVKADISDPPTLLPALKGVDFIFAVTVPAYDPIPAQAIESEFQAIKAIADATVSSSSSEEEGKEKFLIFSTLPSVSELSGGRYNRLTPFEAKFRGEQYIRSLSSKKIKSAFWSGGFFMQNLNTQPFLGPKRKEGKEGGKWVLERPVPAGIKIPYLDVRDIGYWIEPILTTADQDEFVGKTIYAAEGFYGLGELAGLMGEFNTTAEEVEFKQVTEEEFEAGLPMGLGPMFVDGFKGLGEFGYWGKGSEGLVEEGKKMGKGKRLTTFREYLAENPVRLGE